MADTAEGLLRALTDHWDHERTTLANLPDYDAAMAEGERLGQECGALMKRVYLYLERQGPTTEQRHEDAHLGGRGAAATEAELVAAGHTLAGIVGRLGDSREAQELLDIADWLRGRLGAPGSSYPVRLPMTHDQDMAACGQTLAFENGALRDELEQLHTQLAERPGPPWAATLNPYTGMFYGQSVDGDWYALVPIGEPLQPIEVAAHELEPRTPGHPGWAAVDAIVGAEQLRHHIDGTGDAEVAIPPAGDCMEYRKDQPCPHCASIRYHHRTRRCGDCGRRPGTPE